MLASHLAAALGPARPLPRTADCRAGQQRPGASDGCRRGWRRLLYSRNPPHGRLPAALEDLDALLGDVPDIEAGLSDFQLEMGATFGPDGVALSFDNDADALAALALGAVLVDRSHCGRLRLGGEDRQRFLHGQSTANLEALAPGQGCDTVFVTAQARCVDLASCYVQPSGVLVVVSPGMKADILQRLDKVLFPGDKVTLADVSARTCQFSLLGPEAEPLLASLGVDATALAARGHGAHTLLGLRGAPVVVAVGGGLVQGQGFTLIADESCAADLWSALTGKGAVPMGSEAWEVARVVAGRPTPGAELTGDFNPLEAGLFHALCLDKGCYIGQETISKVHNLGAVKQQLWGLILEAPCAPGDTVTAGDKALGKVTSYAATPSGAHHALAYLRCKSTGAQIKLEDLGVTVTPASGGPAVTARVVAPPALSREFPAAPAAGPAGSAATSTDSDAELAARNEAARQQKEAAEAAAAKAREEKLRAMQERLAAWQAQQGQQQEEGSGSA